MAWVLRNGVLAPSNFTEAFERKKPATTERGRRGTEESQIRAMYQQQQPDYQLSAVIREIRQMDKIDGHVKQIHNRTAKALTKGGLILDNPTNNKRIKKAFKAFIQRCRFDNRNKLISDARGLIMEGSLPLQWVLDTDHKHVMRCIRMPSETIRAITGMDGQFVDPANAYSQYNHLEGKEIARFARWQMSMGRLDPDNFDDEGCPGRPMLDAARKRWRQVMMQQEDVIIRRRTRAPMRTVHVLEGATEDQLAEYKLQTESEEKEVTSNYYMNKKGSVTALQGDENLEQIGDVAMMTDAFFAGTPMPKSMLGYVDGMSRDVLMDLKAEFYDELDTLQDSLSASYEHGFRLQLLLSGVNPDDHDFAVRYGERITETPNQRTDRALKQMALGTSRHTAFTTAGLDAGDELERIKDEMASLDPYPVSAGDGIPGVDDQLEAYSQRGHPRPSVEAGQDQPTNQRISITPGNAPKGESATNVSNS